MSAQHSERLQTTACPPAYRFAGYEFDSETGLYYAFARYYSPLLGRFLSTDPLGGSIGSLQSHNAYSYVLNDPTNLSDPSGAVCSGEMGRGLDTPCNPSNFGGGGGSGYGFFGGGWSLFNFLDIYGLGEGSYSAFMQGACQAFLLSSPYGPFNNAWKDNPASLVLKVTKDCFDTNDGKRLTTYTLQSSGASPNGQYVITEQLSDTSLAPPWGQSSNHPELGEINVFKDDLAPPTYGSGVWSNAQYFLVSPNGDLGNSKWVTDPGTTRTTCVDATGLGQSGVVFAGTERQRGDFCGLWAVHSKLRRNARRR